MTELSFKGKEFVYNHHLSVPFRPLVPDAEKGIGPVDLNGNLIIQGDNMHALKALLPMYAGKVDCIFIDPPYNTGNEGWAYNDNVNAPMIKEWLAANPIGIEDGLRHDKWCAMMWPRLRLLHELLAENGSIWIALDDNEAHRAKLILDEIFGEENFLGEVAWKHTEQSKNDEKFFSRNKNTLLVFRKSEDCQYFRFERTDSDNLNYSNPDNDPKGAWRSGDVRSPSLRETLRYRIETPSGRYIDPPDLGWRWSKETVAEKISTGEIVFSPDETRIIRKIYLAAQDGRTPENLWNGERYGTTRMASRQLADIFGRDPFETKKPTQLVRQVLDAIGNPAALVLDSFAGTATTAHAVLEANTSDGGNRKFILVEMEDYADRLTAERVRRVINGYDYSGTQRTELMRESLNWSKLQRADRLTEQVQAIETLHGHEFDRITKQVKDGELIVTGEKAVKDRTEGLGGTFTYCTLGAPIDLDAILQGTDLPAWDALGRALFHMATNTPLDAALLDESTGYLGQSDGQHLWLIYRPDLDWLKSPEAALTLSYARGVATAKEGKHLVFAPARHVSQKMLNDENVPVEFVPLPFALYRIERG